MSDYTALYDEDATLDEQIACFQALINSGDAWRLEGSVGRTAADLLAQGYCALGTEAHFDYWGNRVPARSEVKPGTKGSLGYVKARHPECLPIIRQADKAH